MHRPNLEPLWPAGGLLHGGALSSISAGGDGGTCGETEGAGHRAPPSCPTEPSRAELRNQTGAGGPGSSGRQSAAIGEEVRTLEGLGLGCPGALQTLEQRLGAGCSGVGGCLDCLSPVR